MPDFRKSLSELRRPGILMRAVRFALTDYRRQPMLKRLTPGESRSDIILPRLFAAEAELEEIRRSGDASYSISDHIEVLAALIAETSLWQPRLVSG